MRNTLQKHQRVVIVTYYWPPAGGPGVQRWLLFAKYLRNYGITPIVIIPKNPTYPITDTSLCEEVHEDIQIISIPIFEPYRFANFFSKKETQTISKGLIANSAQQSLLQKILLYIRGNFFIPDARKFWTKPVTTFLKEFLPKENIQTLITTGPPHSIHLIGKKLKESLAIRWIADFRDPWTAIGYHTKLKLSTKSKRKHLELESEVLQQADHILVTSPGTLDHFRNKTKTPITVINNGYEPIKNEKEVVLDKKFTLSHIGSLLSDRNPTNLWKALYELTQTDADFAAAFELQLIGTIGENIRKTLKKIGLQPFTKTLGYVSHQEAIQLQRQSQILLLIEINSPETRCILPGKLYEYMAAKRPILAIGPKGSDVDLLLKQTQTGSFHHYEALDALKVQILNYFNAYRMKNLIVTPRSIAQYSRQSLTRIVADVIKNIGA